MNVGIVVIASLVVASIANGDVYGRMKVCSSILWVTAASYMIYYFGDYNEYVTAIGYYQYQSIFPLISISILHLIKDRLATLLMVLYLIEISINALSFWIEGQGLYIDNAYQLSMWGVFIVQMALMFSRRLTNGVYRGLFGYDMARSSPKANMAAGHHSYSPENHPGED